ncbi:alpha/beta hydrolase [Nakamurella alba]|uniref:alpha/beta hydrolase n=1 Tax=Nakamurella alba TaxID=2665158 RepID=UPI0018AACB0B|nr:alpha/beta hydrolase-fold protein [Nakamurella alba]
MPVHPLLEEVAAGRRGHEEFRQHLRDTGAPMVERTTAGEVAVTFVDEPGSAAVSRLSVAIGPVVGRNTVDVPFTPVAGTPFRALTLRMRSDLRFSYVFTRSGPDGTDTHVPDPFNPPPPFSDYPEARFSGSSVATLPDAAALPWLAEAETLTAPTVASAVLRSAILGNERRIWVSMPPGGSPEGTPLPFVVQLDGTPDHSAPAVRDALVRAGRIRPCAVVLVDQLGPLRYQELRCDPQFSRMLVEELLPWLRDRHPLSHDPADVALAGESFGGLCAAWTALHHPAAFGNAVLQSPSCAYHPDTVYGTGAGDLLRRNPVPTLIADVLAAAPAPVRIFHDAGELEGSVTHSRWLHQVLTDRGYDTVHREFAGGHDYAWWRGLFADALQWCFPPERP